MSSKLEQLRADLARHFADQARPAADAIAFDAPGDPSYEGSRAARIFARLPTWQAFAPGLLRVPQGYLDTDLLGFLQPGGFAYFLPGLLWHALDLDGPDHNAVLADAVVFGLTPPDHWLLGALDDPDLRAGLERQGVPATRESLVDDPIRAQFAAKIAGFSPAQRGSVARALDFLADEYARRGHDNAPRRALDALWGRYLGAAPTPADGRQA